MVRVTKHADHRIRKRLGKPRKVADKLAAAAWEHGYPIKTFTGFFKKYLLNQAREYKSVVKVHKGDIFYFRPDGTLITCWAVPTKYRKQYQERIAKSADNAS